MSTMPVFLSASVPDPKRNPKYYERADVTAIREAVVALARTVLPQSDLVFGGHPAISPLVARVARDLDLFERVVIYQSEEFREVIPRDSLAFERLVWTKKRDNRNASLDLMRDRMLSEHTFRAGIFIGGMEGVEDEWKLFRERHSNAPAFPIASTGGAAAILFERERRDVDDRFARDLSGEWVYGVLFPRLLARSAS
jgi:hypothetical protein